MSDPSDNLLRKLFRALIPLATAGLSTCGGDSRVGFMRFLAVIRIPQDLLCKQEVAGSSPAGSIEVRRSRIMVYVVMGYSPFAQLASCSARTVHGRI